MLSGCGGGGNGQAPASTKQRAPELSSQQKHAFAGLSISEIMQGPGLIGTAPSHPHFSADGRRIYYRWNSPSRLDSLNDGAPLDAWKHYEAVKKDAGTWVLDTESGTSRRLTDAEADTVAPTESQWDRARRRRVELRGGDVYLVDRTAGTTRRLTGTLAAETDIQISPDGARAYFARAGQLYAARFDEGPARQVTRFLAADDPEKKTRSDQRQYLRNEQKKLFDVFQKKRPGRQSRGPKKVYLGKDWNVDRFLVSPSGRFVALNLTKSASGARAPEVPLAITRSGYLETEEARPTVGDVQEKTRVAVLALGADTLATVGADDGMWVSAMGWSPTEDDLLVRGITADWHDRYFSMVTPGRTTHEGQLKPRELDHDHDDAWVGGPAFYETGHWLPDGRGIYFLSEQNGWSHLYTVTRGGRREQITSGPWEVDNAWIDPDRARWYILSNEGRPGSIRLWAMNLDGSDRRLVTKKPGACEVTFSPDMRRAAVLYSTITHPNELYTLTLGDEIKWSAPYTESTTRIFRSYAWIVPRAETFKASDGVSVHVQVFDPRDFGAQPNGAGVIFIHGAGYLQNVIDSWGYYYREYMFHHLLAARGYTVLNVDYRGSAGYGRDCRTAIYLHMGGRDLDDIADAAKFLRTKYGVGKSQVGVYGGSYGGFLTLMAMFRYPDVFRSGAALRSVTDWAHYNHWYTVRILGLPWEHPEAYRRSSPIYFAEGLKGDLLMLHGLRDTNVLAADDLRLSQRLIDLGKTHWELALHPLENHAYKRASSWTDQMRRVYQLFARTLPDGAPEKK